MTKRAAVIRGDGIGPEVVDSMLRVLHDCNIQSEIIMCDGGSEQWVRNGRKDASYIPNDTMKVLEEADMCFKGPVTTIPTPDAPKSMTVTLRQKFDLYANIRPIKTYSRLTPDIKLNCVCFREATEGLYGTPDIKITDDAAIAIRKITRDKCRRLANAAAAWAQSHSMTGIVAITKRNILRNTDGIFWEEMQQSAKDLSEISLSEIYIDNMAQQLVIAPEQFNNFVLASTNLFMDIISELASGLVGSIGLIHSVNMGDSYAMFEASHGSAPTIAGKNLANPTATLLAGAWMAERLGEQEISDAISRATELVIDEGKYVTADIGGNAGTDRMSSEISRVAQGLLRK